MPHRAFKRVIYKFIGGLPYLKVYIHNILIHSENDEAHIEYSATVLKNLHKYSLSINFEKCEFLKREVKFLGQLISENVIKPFIDKKELLRKFTPKTKRHIP
ncbi:Retrovirus-related Pol polyprotein from transposon 17.6 [Dictyocoela muelleri]|nr:Retrovirus-related Pol polyprotein from transposon 17.6 [Dictyocoela muelleri]